MPWPRGYKTCPRVHKQPIVALYLSLRMYSSFITSRPGLSPTVSDTLKIMFLKDFFMYLGLLIAEVQGNSFYRVCQL